MRIIHICVFLCALLLAAPAFAVDDFYGPDDGKASFDDNRRPDLGMGERDGDVDRGDNGDLFLPGDGGSYWEEFYVQDIDFAPFMERLYEVLTNEEWLGQYPEVVEVAEYMRSQGLFDLSGMHTEYAVTGDHISFMMHEDYEGIDPESYYGKFLALPDGWLTSSEYVTGDFLFYFAASNYDDILFIVMEEMLQSDELGEIMEMLGEEGFGFGEMAQVWGIVEALQLDALLDNVITGEMAMVLYSLPPLPHLFAGDVEPGDIDAALMVGINDIDYVLGMIEQYGGDIGLLEREYEGDDWHYYVIQGADGVGLMLSDELAIITPNLDAARMHVQAAEGLGLDPCAFYCDLNFEQLHEQIIGPLMRMAKEELGSEGITLPFKPLAYLLNLPGSNDLGHLTVTTSSYGDGCSTEVGMKKAVVQYMVYYLGLGLCGAAQAGVFDDAFGEGPGSFEELDSFE